MVGIVPRTADVGPLVHGEPEAWKSRLEGFLQLAFKRIHRQPGWRFSLSSCGVSPDLVN